MFHLVGLIRIKSTHVHLARVHARRNETGHTRRRRMCVRTVSVRKRNVLLERVDVVGRVAVVRIVELLLWMVRIGMVIRDRPLEVGRERDVIEAGVRVWMLLLVEGVVWWRVSVWVERAQRL